MSYPLTRRQAQALEVIRARLAADGVAPSYDELGRALGLCSRSSIVGLIYALIERGRLRRMKGRARALSLVTEPARRFFIAISEPGEGMRLVELAPTCADPTGRPNSYTSAGR